MPAKPLTAAARESRQRANIIRKLERLLKNYDRPCVTDADLKAALGEAVAFIRGAAARNNARPGGLGR